MPGAPHHKAIVAPSKPRPPARGLRDTSIHTYRAKRDFSATAEPAPTATPAASSTLIFVVQKHDATRLHYDFRLEHNGVLWSWAIPKGPSLDPADKRLAVHVEDHPKDYAGFEGTIPAGNYGAGTVEIWDRGTWTPKGDPEADIAGGEMKFTLAGTRLKGDFVLVRLKPRPKDRADNWLLIKEHDSHEHPGADATALESIKLKPVPKSKPAPSQPAPPGAVGEKLPASQSPQLATLADAAPDGPDWISEVKFDGYRLLAWVRAGKATLLTRNGQDWTARLPRIARAIEDLKLTDALLDGELVALREDGISSFAHLQAALSDGPVKNLVYYLFDLLHLNGQDLRRAKLRDRKARLAGLSAWRGALRYSDHIDSDGPRLHQSACGMGLEGIICKRADAPYTAGRSRTWVKVKCQGREEFIILGWTDPEGNRSGLGALHLGFYDTAHTLHYIGGVGTGFSAKELTRLRTKLDALASPPPKPLLYAGDPPPRPMHWVKPELVAEIQYIGFSGAGRLRHATYLGLREDKPAADIVRDVPDAEAARTDLGATAAAPRIVQASPRKPARAKPAVTAPHPPSMVTARAPKTTTNAEADTFAGIHLTHPDKPLWPGISKRDLAEYWRAVAPYALPGIANRPLAFVRCPDGIGGQHFFQKHATQGMSADIHAAESAGAPYMFITDIAGLYAAAQIAAIELHTWGATLETPLRPDRLVFDLDPGPGVPLRTIVAAAHEVKDRLQEHGLTSWCRTSGGKGLHVVAPLDHGPDWDTTRFWCRSFAEAMQHDAPDHYVATTAKAKRDGKILIDWLRNGLGSTAIASFSPRARPGAGVATPLAWKDINARLDPAKFTLKTVPDRLAALKQDPWADFAATRQTLPEKP